MFSVSSDPILTSVSDEFDIFGLFKRQEEIPPATMNHDEQMAFNNFDEAGELDFLLKLEEIEKRENEVIDKDVLLSTVTVDRQISQDACGDMNQSFEDHNDDSTSSSDEIVNILTKTAHDYELSTNLSKSKAAAVPQVPTHMNTLQKQQLLQYYSSNNATKSQCSSSKSINGRDISVDREVVVADRRPKRYQSPPDSMSGMSRGAAYARQYRQKNKELVDRMQNELDTLSEENHDLKETVDEMRGQMANLTNEVRYLRSILANESQLSALLKGVANAPGLKFRFPIADEIQEKVASEPSSKKRKHQVETRSGQAKKAKNDIPGVCLHVNGDNVSLEFCARCATDARCDE